MREFLNNIGPMGWFHLFLLPSALLSLGLPLLYDMKPILHKKCGYKAKPSTSRWGRYNWYHCRYCDEDFNVKKVNTVDNYG